MHKVKIMSFYLNFWRQSQPKSILKMDLRVKKIHIANLIFERVKVVYFLL